MDTTTLLIILASCSYLVVAAFTAEDAGSNLLGTPATSSLSSNI